MTAKQREQADSLMDDSAKLVRIVVGAHGFPNEDPALLSKIAVTLRTTAANMDELASQVLAMDLPETWEANRDQLDKAAASFAGYCTPDGNS